MRYRDFVNKIQVPIFTSEQASRVIGESHSNIALSRWVEQGEITRLKRGVYLIREVPIDEQLIANYLYPGSYVSMETVLNQAGIIPDIPNQITSITTGRPRNFVNEWGNFGYSRIKNSLFGGFELIFDSKSKLTMRIATAEKALLDYMYVRGVRDLTDMRIEWGRLRSSYLLTFAKLYPNWIRKEIRSYV